MNKCVCVCVFVCVCVCERERERERESEYVYMRGVSMCECVYVCVSEWCEYNICVRTYGCKLARFRTNLLHPRKT